MKQITETNFTFPKCTNFYRGKVRDLYTIEDQFVVMVTTDRISAFDVVLEKGIPYKGEVLNRIASLFLDATANIVPNWKISTPHPMVTIGYNCTPLPIEIIVRGYLTGSSYRSYRGGARDICGVAIPNGMREHQKFEKPIITPTTKAEIGGHDTDISKEEILSKGLVGESDYNQIEEWALALFKKGSAMAKERGLILVDTKYEFGKIGDKLYLIDEIHTPDSSRYFYADTYQELFDRGEPQRQLSKEFVREWLMDQGFQGREGDSLPPMGDRVIESISQRYIELFEKITALPFKSELSSGQELKEIEQKVIEALSQL
ncbi:MAG: phosphoribosylaminoimidazolesuccinocarboxamide synthase [Bacteroidales bacterium]